MTGIDTRDIVKALAVTVLAMLGSVGLLTVLGPDWSVYAPATCTTTRCFCETARTGNLFLQPSDSWSAFGYVFVGVLMMLVGRRPGGSALTPLAAALFGVTAITVGLGSVIMHATLTLWGQFLDVLGMYLVGSFMLVRGVARWRAIPDRTAMIAYVALCAALVTVLIVAPEVRRYLFAALLISAIAIELLFARPLRRDARLRYYLAGIAVKAVAFAIWNLDQHLILCSPDSLWQGHSAWHLLGATSLWLTFLYYRSERDSAPRAVYTRPMAERPNTPLLDTVDTPADLRKLKPEQLRQLADELRAETISAVGVTGGHLGSGLGVVELTTAIHYVFDTPRDRLVWDVGHQCYPHKILTGRRDRIRTLRQGGGLSGFTKRSESEYDPFGAAHSSTSISAALGFAVANKLKDQPGRAIAVIGDGSMSAGMAYEAMNNAEQAGNRLIVILNDNDMSIAPPVGGLSAYLARVVSSSEYLGLRSLAKKVTQKFSRRVHNAAQKAEEFARGMATGGTLFEELGFYYVGPIDGHNLEHLIPVLENVRDAKEGPVLVHVVTKKGKGYGPAEDAADKYHGVQKFDVVTGTQDKAPPGPPSYQNVFGDALATEADADDRIVAITAAMPSGTGVDRFAKRHPERAFDVGIAEQHAVTFAAGLAAQGMRPFCAIYSTFLQRAYDQVVHDVAIQNLPVRFAMDRAGLVGADGATHAGSFDVTYLATLPNFVVMAPADEAELVHMTHTMVAHDSGPIAVRYPRGNGTGIALPTTPQTLEIGKGRIVREGKTVAILSLGTRLGEALKAAEQLEAKGLSTTVADLRFVKPLDEDMIRKLLTSHEVAVTIEEASVGGLGAHVLTFASDHGLTDAGLKLRTMRLPDRFQDQDKPEIQYDDAGLNAEHIVATVLKALRHNEASVGALA